MPLPAGTRPPVPADPADADVVHAIDGDGAALCAAGISVEPFAHHTWEQVPEAVRCKPCHLIVGTIAEGGRRLGATSLPPRPVV